MIYRPHPYTHRTALKGNALGLDVPRCNGKLELIHIGPDSVMRDGQLVHRMLRVYQCAECRHIVSTARDMVLPEPEGRAAFGPPAESLAWELLNSYDPERRPPDELVKELAHAFELPGSKPRTSPHGPLPPREDA